MATISSAIRDIGRRDPTATTAMAAGLVVTVGAAAVWAAHLSTFAFMAAGIALFAVLGAAAVLWPRAVLVALVLSPALIDLYAGQRLLPEDVRDVARLFSEGLLIVVGVVLAVVAARRGTLVASIRHPLTAAGLAFLAVSVASAVVNAVPPVVASAGLIFTLDAMLLFYLPRMVGFDHPQRHRVMWVIATVVTVTAIIGIGQAVLTPSLLGLAAVAGMSGEGNRVGALVGDPNILGTLIGLAMPFTLFSLVRQPRGRRWWLTLGMAVALGLALLLTYSRGSWLGMAVGFGVVALLIDRRALVASMAVMAIAYVTAVAMPRDMLGGGAQGYDPLSTTINRVAAVQENRDLRTLFVRNAIPILEEHPVLGVGPGQYGGASASIFGSPVHEAYGTDRLLTEQETVDNFWLHLAVEGGAAGVIAYVVMIGAALWGPIRALRGAVGSRFAVPAGIVSGTLVVCVATTSTMLLEGNTVAFLFWFLLGIGSMALPNGPRTDDLEASATPSGG
jgi:O-antigen ligase